LFSFRSIVSTVFIFWGLSLPAGFIACGHAQPPPPAEPPSFIKNVGSHPKYPPDLFIVAYGEGNGSREAETEAKARVAEKVQAELKSSLESRRHTLEEQSRSGEEENTASTVVREMTRNISISSAFKYAHLIRIDEQSQVSAGERFYAVAYLSRLEAASAIRTEMGPWETEFNKTLAAAKNLLARGEAKDLLCYVDKLLELAARLEEASVRLASVEGSSSQLHKKRPFTTELIGIKTEAAGLLAKREWRVNVNGNGLAPEQVKAVEAAIIETAQKNGLKIVTGGESNVNAENKKGFVVQVEVVFDCKKTLFNSCMATASVNGVDEEKNRTLFSKEVGGAGTRNSHGKREEAQGKALSILIGGIPEQLAPHLTPKARQCKEAW
jgi:hypothetical protein